MRVRGHRLGIQSWCLRTFKRSNDLVRALTLCGLDAIELSPHHVDPANAGAVKDVLQRMKNSRVVITSFGVVHMGTNERMVRPYFEFARQAGFDTIGADPDPNAIPLLERLCEEYHMRVAIHNHGKKHRYGTPRQFEEILLNSSHRIGLCMDTGWVLEVGEDPAEIIEKYAARLFGVHIKDFNFRPDGSVEDVIVGTGRLDLPGLFDGLRKIGYDGYLTLEYEGDEKDPIPAIKKNIEQLSRLQMR